MIDHSTEHPADEGPATKEQAIEQYITPASFTPITPNTKQIKIRFNALQFVVVLLLFISVLITWFVVTARSVTINIEPAQARIDINKGISFQLGDHYLARPGEYQVVAHAEGYLKLIKDFVVSKDDFQALSLVMDKMPGHLNINSSPSGAEIFVDNKILGISPTTLSDLPPGEHNIELKKPRYFSHTTTISIEGLDQTQSLEAKLKPAWGYIELATTPEGADVFIDGEKRGNTPLTTELLSQGEVIKISLAGYKPLTKTLSVEVGETLTLPNITLDPADGNIELSSYPSGATVTINGEFRGTTPTTLAVAANQALTISLFLNGYITDKKSLSLSPGETEILSVNLTANKGDIRIVTSPADASVWIDGRLRGSAGQTFSLPSRAHRIEIKKPGYATEVRTITPQPSLNQVVTVSLLTEQQARWAKTPTEITTHNNQVLMLFKPQRQFSMGASRRESGRKANEVQRDVQITRPFYLATKEVTNSQFKQFQPQHSSQHASGNTLDRPSQPVVNISWEQAALYCNWLSKKSHLTPVYTEQNGKITATNMKANGYRLPTEAEWAWAARTTATGEKKFGWGPSFPPTGKVGNFADVSAKKIVGHIITSYNDGHIASAPVGSFPPNEKGLYDLDGNVAEWVNDYYGIEFNLGTKADKDPLGPEQGEFRLIRGASWRHSNITELRLSFRDYGNKPRDDLGFRIARFVE